MPAGNKPDPYTVLGIDRTASAGEIRVAYRALVARYHPDRHQGNPLEDLASERMAEINQAYDLLSDPVRRSTFDRHGFAPAGATATPDGGETGDARRRTGPAARPGMNPIAKWVLIVLALPLLVRGGAALVRAIAGVEGGLFGALSGLRGTPAGLVVALLALALLGWALWRRHRNRRRKDADRA
jgi:curved DNA-binding protein CbpA